MTPRIAPSFRYLVSSIRISCFISRISGGSAKSRAAFGMWIPGSQTLKFPTILVVSSTNIFFFRIAA
jgi:hypothetical protein